jgi:plasmid stabilization system protein ParE
VKINISRTAVADIERLRAFLSEKNPAAAGRVVAALDAAVRSLDTFPDRGRPALTPGARELVPFGRSAYVLRYAHLSETDEIVILRIWHGREQHE